MLFSSPLTFAISSPGMNGAGKSTFAALIAGDLMPTSGTLTRSPHVRVGYFAQHSIENLPGDLTGVRYLIKEYPGLDEQGARKALGAWRGWEKEEGRKEGSNEGAKRKRKREERKCKEEEKRTGRRTKN